MDLYFSQTLLLLVCFAFLCHLHLRLICFFKALVIHGKSRLGLTILVGIWEFISSCIPWRKKIQLSSTPLAMMLEVKNFFFRSSAPAVNASASSFLYMWILCGGVRAFCGCKSRWVIRVSCLQTPSPGMCIMFSTVVGFVVKTRSISVSYLPSCVLVLLPSDSNWNHCLFQAFCGKEVPLWHTFWRNSQLPKVTRWTDPSCIHHH